LKRGLAAYCREKRRTGVQSIRRLVVSVTAAVVLGGGLVGVVGISGDGIDQDDLISAGAATPPSLATESGALHGVQFS
jgi:hypothetical protein